VATHCGGIDAGPREGDAYRPYGTTTMKLFETLKHRLAERRRYVRTLQELRDLSARDLDDIGISPYEIRRVAREASRAA
jgi:uncharacterized protein YjiS (DUF1127 family)